MSTETDQGHIDDLFIQFKNKFTKERLEKARCTFTWSKGPVKKDHETSMNERKELAKKCSGLVNAIDEKSNAIEMADTITRWGFGC